MPRTGPVSTCNWGEIDQCIVLDTIQWIGVICDELISPKFVLLQLCVASKSLRCTEMSRLSVSELRIKNERRKIPPGEAGQKIEKRECSHTLCSAFRERSLRGIRRSSGGCNPQKTQSAPGQFWWLRSFWALWGKNVPSLGPWTLTELECTPQLHFLMLSRQISKCFPHVPLRHTFPTD